jgi:transketolase
MAENEGPMYMRLGREPAEEIYEDDEVFSIGGSKQLLDGDYAAIIAYGSMVAKSLSAAKELEKQGKKVRVIDMYSVKPIDSETIVSETIVKAAKETRGIVTVEDHNIKGGLGGAVSEVVTDNYPTRVIKIGIRDVFGCSGQRDELFEMY